VAPEENAAEETGVGGGDESKSKGRRARRQQKSEETANGAGEEVLGNAAAETASDAAEGNAISVAVAADLVDRLGGARTPAPGVVGGDGDAESWDLCLVVDPVTEKEEDARKEVLDLFLLLRKEGLMLTNPHPLDPKAGFTGQVFALCTASQDELEQEAEIMGLNKPLKLPIAAQLKFRKTERYGRVTAPFTVARRAQFHSVPYLDGDDVLLPEFDKSGLQYFSACERQNLLEHIIESKIRQVT